MSARTTSLALAAALAMAATPRVAHAHVESWEVWTELGARVIPLRRLRLTFTQNTRFSAYGLRRIIPEVEADYRVIGPLRLGVGYRYLWRLDGRGDNEEGHLVHFDATAQFELGHFDFELRSRVQWRGIDKEKHGIYWEDIRDMWRNRLNVEWHLPGPFTANAFLEHWTRLDDGPTHDRFRAGAGFAVDVSRWRFQLYYMRDMPTFVDDPNVNMFGVSARWTLDMTAHRRRDHDAGGAP